MLRQALAIFACATAAASHQSNSAPSLQMDDECEGLSNRDACAFSALQRKGLALNTLHAEVTRRLASVSLAAPPDLRPTQAVTPPDAKERHMLKIIKEGFSQISGPGYYLGSNYLKLDSTWKACGEVDWTRNPGLKKNIHDFKDYPFWPADDLELTMCEGHFDEEHASCSALQAALNVTRELAKQFPEGPKFANAFVVDWGRFPSWESGAVGDVDWNTEPPSAPLLNGNGILGYSLCNMIRLISTQSPNQQASGTCSHVALLDALAHKAPAKIIEMAVRLLWTGRTTPDVEFPCEYIYSQQPGLVPWQEDNGSWVPRAATAHMKGKIAECLGNTADCNSAAGSPLQSVGLAYMWSEASISEADMSNHGSCTQGRHLAALAYPGMPKDLKSHIQDDQAGDEATVLWGCQNFVDPKGRSCRLLFNVEACDPDISVELCKNLSTIIFSQVYQDKLDSYEGPVDGFSDIPEWKKLWQDLPGSQDIVEGLLKRIGEGDLSLGLQNYQDFYGFDRSDTPSATEELLQTACQGAVAVLSIDSTPLDAFGTLDNYTGQVPFYGLEPDKLGALQSQASEWLKEMPDMAKPSGSCDHVVYLESCDEDANVYTIWSWRFHIKLTKEVLLGHQMKGGRQGLNSGMICAAVVAENISWSQEDIHWSPDKAGVYPGDTA